MTHDPELVEKVAVAVRAAINQAYFDNPECNVYESIARYALALAERAADEAVSAYRRGEDGVLAVAVERAVEGA